MLFLNIFLKEGKLVLWKKKKKKESKVRQETSRKEANGKQGFYLTACDGS